MGIKNDALLIDNSASSGSNGATHSRAANNGAAAICDCNVIHKEVVNRVRASMPSDEALFDLAELFKVFGDSTRVKILCALFQNRMCVCDIAALLGMTKSAISHQLRVLKQAKLAKYKKEGKVVYYSLEDDHIKNIFDQGFSHIME